MVASTEIFLYFLACLSLACLSSLHWKRRWLYYWGASLPGPLNLPLVGCAYLFRGGEKEMFSTLMKLAHKYRPTGKFWIFYDLYVMITRPEDVEKVLKHQLTKGHLYKFISDSIGHGLITSPVPVWEVHRRLINPTFNQRTLNSYVSSFVERAKDVATTLKSCEVSVDIFTIFTDSSFRIIAETCMEIEPLDAKKQKDAFHWLSRYIELLTFRVVNPLLHNDLLWNILGFNKQLQMWNQKAIQFSEEVLFKKRIEVEHESHSDRGSFLNQLIKSIEEGKLSSKEVVEEIQTMFVAGTETTARTISFVVLVLAIHQEIQEKVYQETLTVLGLTNRDPVPEDLNRMEYTERVLKETMRLFPVGVVLSRHLGNDLVLEDQTVIPKGSTVFVPVNYVHRDPHVWLNPSKFDPDRFLPQEVEKRHRCSFLPFSAPPRNCIGMKFAMMSMKVMLIEILRSVKIVSCQYESLEDIDLSISMILNATHGYKVTVAPRQ